MNYRTAAGSMILGYVYVYDTLGNISTVKHSMDSGDTAFLSYTYDDLGQLTGATDLDAGYNYGYTYDTVGNIRSSWAQSIISPTNVTKIYTYGNAQWLDLLTAVKVGSTSRTITYPTDGNGNVTAGTSLTWYN